MELNELITIVTSVSVAVVGWVIAHWLTSQREAEQKMKSLNQSFQPIDYTFG